MTVRTMSVSMHDNHLSAHFKTICTDGFSSSISHFCHTSLCSVLNIVHSCNSGSPCPVVSCCDATLFMHVTFSGFPLDKAVEYAELRNPLLINDLNMQYFIQDR